MIDNLVCDGDVYINVWNSHENTAYIVYARVHPPIDDGKISTTNDIKK